MKKYLLLALALSSSSVIAHSHMPQQYGGKDKPAEAVTFTGTKIVPITVGNISNTPTEYEISINGVKQSTTPTIGKDTFIKLQVPVKISKKGVPENFKICSTSVPSKEGVSYRTRICTYAKLIWAKR